MHSAHLLAMVLRGLLLPEGDIDGFLILDIEIMRCNAFGSAFPLPASRCRGLLSLCISDTAKQLLLSNESFIPHVIDGLMLDPEHPRKEADEAVKTAVQRDFAECIQQMSLFPPGCAALQENEAVIQALSTLKDKAWSEEAKICAEGALIALVPPEPLPPPDGEKHVMLSYQWDAQATVKRINDSLIKRGYATWFDLTHMKGEAIPVNTSAQIKC